MTPGLAFLIRVAIESWPETLRLCLIIVVVAATPMIWVNYLVAAALPYFMR